MTPLDSEWSAAVVQDLAGLDALEGEWAQLYARCPTATPFQTHSWSVSWARTYLRPGQPRVAVVRCNGRLVAVAPCYVRRVGPWRVLAPLGGAITDHTDVLVEPGTESAAWWHLTQALLGTPGWQVVDLPELPPRAAAYGWARGWPGRVTRLPSSTCLELPAAAMPHLLARMPARTANTMRRKLRKADAAGFEVTEVAPAAVPTALDDLLRLHRVQWSGRNGNPVHTTDRFRVHLSGALTRMVPDGQAALLEYRLAGELVLSQIELLGRETLSYYLAGVSPRARELVDTSALQVREDVALAVRLGLRRYSMLRGTEDYKARWRPDVVVQQRLLLHRPGGVGAAGFPLVVRLLLRARVLLKAHAPWLQVIRVRVSRARARGASSGTGTAAG
jgi:CelD/BcsL family acetyltransferase involved in cellulose biosynthesis